MTYTKKRIAVLHSQQPWNQYAGEGTGVSDSEQAWMRKLATEVTQLLAAAGHDAILSPLGHSYADNVSWVNKQNADLLLSLHSNATAAAGDKPKGIGIYYVSPAGLRIAQALAPHLKGASAAGVVYLNADLRVSELVKTKPPAVLIENEYHDWEGSATTGGASWIRDAGNRTELAQAYQAAIIDLFGCQEMPEEPDDPEEPAAELMPIRVAEINGLSTRFDNQSPLPNWPDRRKGLVEVIKDADADAYLLVEFSEPMRDYLRDRMPGGETRWLVWVRGDQAIMFDSHRLRHSKFRPVEFGPTSYHGGLWAPFVDRKTGQPVTLGVFHLPPLKVSTVAAQKGYFRKFLASLPDGPMIIGGDGNAVDLPSWAPDLVDSRKVAEASSTRDEPTNGRRIIDFVLSTEDVGWRGYNVKPTKGRSDHQLVVAAGDVPILIKTS